jgi:hypothetical protein
MSDKFIAIQVIAEVSRLTPDEIEALPDRIRALLGCDDTEEPCAMEMYASTVVDDVEKAYNWIH